MGTSQYNSVESILRRQVPYDDMGLEKKERIFYEESTDTKRYSEDEG